MRGVSKHEGQHKSATVNARSAAALPFETAASPPPRGEGGTGLSSCRSRAACQGSRISLRSIRATRDTPLRALSGTERVAAQFLFTMSNSAVFFVPAARFCARVFAFLFSIRPVRGGRSAGRRSISAARFGARQSALTEARRASGGTRSPLRRSTAAIFGRGPRFHLRHFFRICAASSSQPGRSAWRAGSRTSRGLGYEPRPQDATPRSAFGSSPEDGPSDEQGFSHPTANTNGSQ
jgi:hypothetical protein